MTYERWYPAYYYDEALKMLKSESDPVLIEVVKYLKEDSAVKSSSK